MRKEQLQSEFDTLLTTPAGFSAIVGSFMATHPVYEKLQLHLGLLFLEFFQKLTEFSIYMNFFLSLAYFRNANVTGVQTNKDVFFWPDSPF
jgi:hypothetical protein